MVGHNSSLLRHSPVCHHQGQGMNGSTAVGNGRLCRLLLGNHLWPGRIHLQGWRTLARSPHPRPSAPQQWKMALTSAWKRCKLS